jgi:hypothetical protein
LLVAILAAMTASLLFAFWIDAQSRRKAEPVEPARAMPARTTSVSAAPFGAAPVRTKVPSRVLTGRVRNGTVLIDAPDEIPDGTRVSIRIIPDASDGPVLTPGEATR